MKTYELIELLIHDLHTRPNTTNNEHYTKFKSLNYFIDTSYYLNQIDAYQHRYIRQQFAKVLIDINFSELISESDELHNALFLGQ